MTPVAQPVSHNPQPAPHKPRPAWVGLLLSVILLAAAALRIPSHNWDQDQHLHTDERYVTRVAIDRVQIPPGVPLGAYLDPQRSPLDPRVQGALYTYGALPLYLGKAAAVAAFQISGDAYFTTYNGVQQTGRVVAGLADTLTVLLVFLVGLRLWGATAGLLAAAFYALAVLPIQIAHFYISEPFMTTCMTATLLLSVLAWQTGRRRLVVLAGLAAGLALACKLSAAPVLLLPLAGGWGMGDRGWGRLGLESDEGRGGMAGGRRRTARRVLGGLGLALGAAALGLFVGDPFAVLDAPTYLRQVQDQALIQSGLSDQPWTRQYVGTWPVLYPWGQLVLLGAGPLVGLAGTWGLLASGGWRAAWRRGGPARAPVLLVLGAAAYFASIAFLEAKWLRYLLPLVPYLCLAAGFALLGHSDTPGRTVRAPDRRRIVWPVLVLTSAVLGALAFTAIYGAENTRVQASRWITAHVPAGARLGLEAGDDPLPRRLQGDPAPDATYTPVWLDLLADRPPAAESRWLQGQLAGVDYLIVSSTRIAGVVPHLPWRYAVQIRYYDLLGQAQLGFTPVAAVTSYPALLGLRLPDDGPWLDATFTVYDHPPVRIFQHTRLLSTAAWDALFAGAVRQPWAPTRQAP